VRSRVKRVRVSWRGDSGALEPKETTDHEDVEVSGAEVSSLVVASMMSLSMEMNSWMVAREESLSMVGG
jgi:hypothetical protein